MNTLLVVVAHPDDETLGCGGAIARRAAEGWTIRIMHVATGNMAETMLASACTAAAILGAREPPTWAGYADQELHRVPHMMLVRDVNRLVRSLAPSVVITHHPGDYNPDHRAVFDAVRYATRPSLGEFAPLEVWTMEVPSSTERSFDSSEPFRPNIYVDISATLPLKIRALECYRSEIREFPHPRSVEGIRSRARMRGSEVGMAEAEAFHLLRRVEWAG